MERESSDRAPKRDFELDGVVFTLGAIAFAGIAAILYFLLAYASGAGPVPVFIASTLIAAAIVLAWLAAYPHRATAAAPSLVVLAALVFLPRIFVMDGALLREAAGMPASRLQVAIALNVGGLGIGFFALLVFGFVIPLIASILAVRRCLPGASRRLAIHLKLLLGAFIVLALPFTALYEDASFALLRPAREEAVRAVVSGMAPETASGWAGQRTLPQRFPRLACCNNTVIALEDGGAVLFPITGAGANSRAYLYDPGTRYTSFRTIADYGGGWRLVELRQSPEHRD